MTHKIVADYYKDNPETFVEHFINTKSRNTEWYLIKYDECGVTIWECPTGHHLEKLLVILHTEGSLSDHDTFKVWHDGKYYKYKILAKVK